MALLLVTAAAPLLVADPVDGNGEHKVGGVVLGHEVHVLRAVRPIFCRSRLVAQLNESGIDFSCLYWAATSVRINSAYLTDDVDFLTASWGSVRGALIRS